MWVRRRGFTLVELLVVIAIVGTLTALLLPAVQAAREAARRTQCANHLRQIGLGLHSYHLVERAFPPGNINRTAGFCPGMDEPAVSYATRFGNWLIAILPFLEQGTLSDRYDARFANDAPENRLVRESFMPTYVCPADYETALAAVPATGPAARLSLPYMPGSYRAVSGRSDDGFNYLDSEMMFSYAAHSRGAIHMVGVWGFHCETIAGIRDGLSQTLIVGEATTRSAPRLRTFWAYPYAYYTMSGVTDQARILLGDFDRCVEAGGNGGDIPCRRGWGGLHSGGINFCVGDGSVRMVSTSVDMTLLGNLATIAGSEVADLP